MTRESSAPSVLVFAKTPRAGEVKTRLIPLLGREGAAALHARLIERTLQLAGEAALGPVVLYATAAGDRRLRDCAARYGACVREQASGELGQRMESAFEDALAGISIGPAILIGTDCPALGLSHLRDAARALAQGENAVFVPVEDGGYALIGLNHVRRRLFEDIDWSSERVMSQTRERLREMGWSWTELETLWDVDRPADYERLVASHPEFRGNHPGISPSHIG